MDRKEDSDVDMEEEGVKVEHEEEDGEKEEECGGNGCVAVVPFNVALLLVVAALPEIKVLVVRAILLGVVRHGVVVGVLDVTIVVFVVVVMERK
jgi:hypothetical protein